MTSTTYFTASNHHSRSNLYNSSSSSSTSGNTGTGGTTITGTPPIATTRPVRERRSTIIFNKYNNPASNNYSTPSSSSSSSKYLANGGSTPAWSPTSSSYTKARSSYDLNSSSSSFTTGSFIRPSSYTSSSYSPSSSSFIKPTSATTATGSSHLAGSSKYSSSSSSGSSSLYDGGIFATPVTLIRFNQRRSSFDIGDSDTPITSNAATPVAKVPVAGLINLGNTCYMNSVLQALFATEPLREFVIMGLESGRLNSELTRLFKEMSSNRRFGGHLDPDQFHTAFVTREPKFKGKGQQDAQEFLSYLLSDLHDEQNKVKGRSKGLPYVEPKSAKEAWTLYRERYNDSKLVDLFVGQFSSVIRCSQCGHESTCWDPFWDLSLAVPRHRSRVDIEECLQEFCAQETLDGDEQPICSECKQHRKSTKRLSIVFSPKILIIHLKKFSNNGFKLSSDIIVNEKLKIEAITTTGSIYSSSANSAPHPINYELYACVCHHGFSARSGHYTAFCQYDNKWYHCDDRSVREVTDSFSMATLKDAYVLFYRLRDTGNTTTTTGSSSPITNGTLTTTLPSSTATGSASSASSSSSGSTYYTTPSSRYSSRL